MDSDPKFSDSDCKFSDSDRKFSDSDPKFLDRQVLASTADTGMLCLHCLLFHLQLLNNNLLLLSRKMIGELTVVRWIFVAGIPICRVLLLIFMQK